jgi:putative ABC transport system permease protein
MKLAWSNLVHDRLRFLVTVAGIAFAIFLMLFEGSLLAGFSRAASRVIEATDVDLWIAARGVSCIDFPVPLPRRFRELAQGVNGVQSVSHLVTGFASWQKPSGARQTVIVIGADRGAGPAFPSPGMDGNSRVLVDRSNVAALGVAVPMDVEISRRRATVMGILEGFGSFVGSPYVFSDFEDAAGYIGLEHEETVFLLVRTVPHWEPSRVRHALQQRLPEADIWTREEFAGRARTFWLTQTEAGGSLLLASVLGFLVGLAIVSQSIYATTMENLEEFATLRAMGASRWFVQRVVLAQAGTSGVAGCAAGFVAAYPALGAARAGIAWIFTPWWLPPTIFAAGLVMCLLASLLSIRKAVSVAPGEVFRA